MALGRGPFGPYAIVRLDFTETDVGLMASVRYLPVGVHVAPLAFAAGFAALVGPPGALLFLPVAAVALLAVWVSGLRLRRHVVAVLTEIRARVER